MFVPPAGLPLSAFTPSPVSTLGPPPPILAERIDPTTGEVLSILEGEDPTDAALLWQLRVRQGSGAALGDNGNRLHLITKATEGAPIQIADEGRRVTDKFRARGDVDEVVVTGSTPGGSTAIKALVVQYRNTHTAAKRGLPIGGA